MFYDIKVRDNSYLFVDFQYFNFLTHSKKVRLKYHKKSPRRTIFHCYGSAVAAAEPLAATSLLAATLGRPVFHIL